MNGSISLIQRKPDAGTSSSDLNVLPFCKDLAHTAKNTLGGHLLRMPERFLDDLPQSGQMDVLQLVDVQAHHTRLVFAEFLKKGLLILKSGQDVQRQILLSRRETYLAGVAFVPAGVFVMVFSEPDDISDPKDWFEPGDLAHHAQDYKAVFASLFIGNPVEKLYYIFIRGFCFQLCHSQFLMIVNLTSKYQPDSR